MKTGFFLGMTWYAKSKQPNITFFDKNKEVSIEFPIPKQWQLATGTKRHCTGYISPEGHNMCPNDAVLDKNGSSSSCFTCMSSHAFSCRAICRGLVCQPSSDRVREICFDVATTGVYLTLIGKQVKVGVSSNPIRRWLDQGSDYSILLWKGNGLTARKIEHNIGKQLGLTLRVTFKQKLKALQQIMDESKARKTLFNLRARMQQELDLPKSKEFAKDLFNLLQYQKPAKLAALRNIKPIYQPIKKQTLISGQHGTFKGKILLIKRSGSFYAYNFKQLLGWNVKDPSKVEATSHSQQSLLSFMD